MNTCYYFWCRVLTRLGKDRSAQYKANLIKGHGVSALVTQWGSTMKSPMSLHCHKLIPILKPEQTGKNHNLQTITIHNA